MKLFSKDNDYNLILEKILDSKYFSSNSKSLLLSMIYKIESCYEDYRIVKNIDKTKEEFLEELIETIKKYCDNIKLVEPETKEAEILAKNNLLAVTNEKERSILSYPTEIALLYAISDVLPKYFYIPDSFLLKNSFQSLLVNGFNQNNLEILSDFNGWSWDINLKLKNNITDNLIYQNFVILFGIKFMDDWMKNSSTKKNSLDEIKAKFVGTKYFEYLCKYLYSNSVEKDKKKIDKIIEAKEKEYRIIENKTKFFDDIKLQKMKYLKELKNIDILLNDKEKLMKKYISVNLKLPEDKKFSTSNAYKKSLEFKRENCLKEINRLGNLMKPTNYLNYKKELEDSINFVKISEKENYIKSIQVEFVKALKREIEELENHDEIISFIFKLRYYKNLYLNENEKVSSIKKLNLDEVLKILIKKSIFIEKPILRKIVLDEEKNFEIIKNILDTKIINLKEIKFEVNLKENNLAVRVFEDEVFEKDFEIEFENSKKEILVKQNKKLKLFI